MSSLPKNGRFISIVIPTFGRAPLLRRALHSALAQTWRELEVVVVVDGPDPDAMEVLREAGDARVRWLVLPGRSGSARARNAGVQAAAGEWIAFLDDDDEWLPGKLTAQMETASRSTHRFPVISTKIVVRGNKGDLVWPRRAPAPGESISEYLLCRSGLFSGDGQFVTSAILARRELMLECPFNPEVRKHDDTEWYLTAACRSDVEFLVVPEPLTIWHQQHVLPRVSQSEDWHTSYAWAARCRPLMTRRAYASFLLNAVGAEIAEAGDLRGFPLVLREAFRHGSPRALDLMLAGGYVLFPKTARQSLRQWKARLSGSVAKGSPRTQGELT